MNLATILISAGAGAVASILVAYVTAHLTARQDLRHWRAEIAEKYATFLTEQPEKAQALARQLAIGVLITEWGDAARRDKVFVAPHTRMTAGRDPLSELVLDTAAASWRHFSISADSNNVYVEDLGSTNGVFLNDCRVQGRSILKDGDILRINDMFHIEFRKLIPNL